MSKTIKILALGGAVIAAATAIGAAMLSSDYLRTSVPFRRW